MALHIQVLDGIVTSLRTRSGKIIAGIFMLALFIITFLPHAISYAVRDWLNNNGADKTQVEDVNFNLFTGKLEFTNLRITVANEYPLLIQNAWVNADWFPLFQKTFHIKELFIENTDIIIEEKLGGQLVFAGIKPAANKTNQSTPNETDAKKSNWGFNLEKLNIINSRFRYVRPDLNLQLAINKASLTGLDSVKKQAGQLSLQGTLNDTPLSINASLTPFANIPGIKAKLILEALPLSTFKQIAKQHVDINAGTLGIDIDLDASYGKDTGLTINENGQIRLARLDINHAGSQIKTNKLSWQGSLKASIPLNESQTDVKIEGSIHAEDLAVINQQQASTLLSIKTLSADKLQASTNQLHIDEITISTLIADLQRDAQGTILLPKSSIEKNTDKPVEEIVTTNSQPFGLRINHIVIKDNSSLQFKDKSTTPDFVSTVSLNNVDIRSLDTSKPEQATVFIIDGKVGKFSTLNAKGNVHPFAEKLNLDMTAKLKAVEMPPLSSYTSGMLGHNLLSGQLNSDIKVIIKDDIIDAKSKLLLSNTEVMELTPEEKKKINTSASAPLSMGLSMLRDQDNNINLDLPFKGNINDPNIDISDAINQVIGKAMSTAALAYLKFSLQPFGALLALADIAGDIGKGVQLQPVLFAAANTQLDANAIQYKTKIAKILTERPLLRIKICGIATSQDKNNLIAKELALLKAKQAKSKAKTEENLALPVIPDATLLAIAQQRADSLKGALINEHKIGADRLFSCLPKIDSEAGSEPRVEVGI